MLPHNGHGVGSRPTRRRLRRTSDSGGAWFHAGSSPRRDVTERPGRKSSKSVAVNETSPNSSRAKSPASAMCVAEAGPPQRARARQSARRTIRSARRRCRRSPCRDCQWYFGTAACRCHERLVPLSTARRDDPPRIRLRTPLDRAMTPATMSSGEPGEFAGMWRDDERPDGGSCRPHGAGVQPVGIEYHGFARRVNSANVVRHAESAAESGADGERAFAAAWAAQSSAAAPYVPGYRRAELASASTVYRPRRQVGPAPAWRRRDPARCAVPPATQNSGPTHASASGDDEHVPVRPFMALLGTRCQCRQRGDNFHGGGVGHWQLGRTRGGESPAL